jgi:hypothetical protein
MNGKKGLRLAIASQSYDVALLDRRRTNQPGKSGGDGSASLL